MERSENNGDSTVCNCVTVPLHIVNLRNVHFQSVIPIGTQHACDQCNQSFARPQYLARHIQVDHPIAFPCDECEQIFPALDLVLEHVRNTHLASQDIKCPICNSVFENENQVAVHLKGHFLEVPNSEKSGVFSCTDCNYVTPKKSNLDRHMKKHKPSSIQGKESLDGKTKDFKESESRKSSEKPGPKRFICAECGKSYAQNQTLNRHMKERHSSVSYPCDQCEMTFHRTDVLARHIDEVHNSDKSHKCPDCALTFARQSDLTRHVKDVHNSEKINN